MGSKNLIDSSSLSRRVGALGAFMAMSFVSPLLTADIIWSGDYSPGSFVQWHTQADSSEVNFHQIPPYGRPIQYGGQHAIHLGNGELLSLVARTARAVNGIQYSEGPTRGASEFAARFVVKNSFEGAEVNGTNSGDCDVPYNSSADCTARRTELTVQGTLPAHYNAMPLMSERWVSFSAFVPADWDDGGSGAGITVFQLKSQSPNTLPFFEIQINSGEWRIFHRVTDELNGTTFPWQKQMWYTASAPARGDSTWSDTRDFPDENSQSALGSLRKGGWTDWVMQVKLDPAGTDVGGAGFLTLWKREGNDSWVKVLHIFPKETTRGGMSFNHGIGINHPAGFGIKAGLYGHRDQFWGLSAKRVIYNANIKVGSDRARFQQMSPDESTPDQESPPPRPPQMAPIG